MSTSDSVAMRVCPMRVRAVEARQAVTPRDRGGITQILDQLERAAQGQDLGAFHILDIVGEPADIAAELEAVAEGVVGGLVGLDDGGAELLEAPVHLGPALLDAAADVEPGFADLPVPQP